MNLIGWIILGALAGMAAKMITHEEGGLLKNIILGVLGGLIGGGIVQLIGGSDINGFNLYSFIVATLGAILLIGIGRMFTKKA
jgi:uncharacterized membrane protein YeaQ/YmgE (transglycosylase-associated protein family)